MNSLGMLTISLMIVSLFFEPGNARSVDALEFVRVFRRGSDFCHHFVQISLGFAQDGGRLRRLARGARQSQGSGGFVQCAQGFDSGVVFGNAVFTEQTGSTVVSGACVERHGDIINAIRN